MPKTKKQKAAPAKRKGYILRTNGVIEPAKEKMSLDEMYASLGCGIVQLLRVGGVELWCDEEGQLNESQVNDAATRIYRKFTHAADFNLVGDVYLRGPALLADRLVTP